MLEQLNDLWLAFVGIVEAYPPLLAIGIIILAGIGVPASPLLILCGAVWGSFLPAGWVVLFGVSSLYVASIWPWLLCSWIPETWLDKIPFINPNKWRERFLSKSENVWTFLFILRFTPGVPFSLHNIIPGILKIPAKPYLIMSFLSCLTAGMTMILLGDAIASGKIILVFAAVVLVVLVSFGVKKIAARSENSRKAPETQSL